MNFIGIETGFNQFTRQTMPHRDYSLHGSHVNVGSIERAGSVLLGAFLMYRAIRSRRLRSFVFGSAGMSLVNRGISGICPVYKRMNLSSTSV